MGKYDKDNDWNLDDESTLYKVLKGAGNALVMVWLIIVVWGIFVLSAAIDSMPK